MLGQLPDVQIVFNLYLSTNPLSSVYFSPIGNLTFNHFGFPTGNIFEVVAVSIKPFLHCKDMERLMINK